MFCATNQLLAFAFPAFLFSLNPKFQASDCIAGRIVLDLVGSLEDMFSRDATYYDCSTVIFLDGQQRRPQ